VQSVDGKQDESVLRAMPDQAGMDRTNEARSSAPHQAFAPKSMMREGYDRAASTPDRRTGGCSAASTG
jgi:hypothetical protein